jgi:hypothetical protein
MTRSLDLFWGWRAAAVAYIPRLLLAVRGRSGGSRAQ